MRLKPRFHSIFFYFNHIVGSVPWFCLSVLVIAYRFCTVCLLVRCWFCVCCTVLDSLQTRSPQTVLIKKKKKRKRRRSADEASGSVSLLQKDADRAVVVAVTSRAVFESGSDDGDGVYGLGVASPLLQVKFNNCCFCVCVCVEKLLPVPILDCLHVTEVAFIYVKRMAKSCHFISCHLFLSTNPMCRHNLKKIIYLVLFHKFPLFSKFY